MNFLAAVAEVPGSVHEWSQGMSMTILLWGIIILLASAVIWFILRDRSSIAAGLEGLTAEFKKFREVLAEKYVMKDELNRVEGKIDRHIEHSTFRDKDRRVEIEAEG